MNLRNKSLIDEIVKLGQADIEAKLFGSKAHRERLAKEREKRQEAKKAARRTSSPAKKPEPKKPDMPKTAKNSGKNRSELAKAQKKDKDTGRFAEGKAKREKASSIKKAEREKSATAKRSERERATAANKAARDKASQERATKSATDKAAREKAASEKTAAREAERVKLKTKAYDSADEANTFLYNAKVNGAKIEKTGAKEYTVTMPNGTVTKVTFEEGTLDTIGKKKPAASAPAKTYIRA